MSNTRSHVEGYNLTIVTKWENLDCDDRTERLYLPGPFRSVMQGYGNSDISRRNETEGYYFFTKDSMRFFRSRVIEEVTLGRLFITSEKNEGMGYEYPRLYTVRAARDDGTIATVSNFQEFETLRQARSYVRNLEKQFEREMTK